MSLIEKAAERLEKLKQAGALPAAAAPYGTAASPGCTPAEADGMPVEPTAAAHTTPATAPIRPGARQVDIDLAALARAGMGASP